MTSPKFVWQVDPELCAAAQRFIDTFNALFGPELPPPAAQYAHIFGGAADKCRIDGRCVRLGQILDAQPSYYHWAIASGPTEQFTVREFWASEIWTTERYRYQRHLVHHDAQWPQREA
jgi:hypothetical protein